MFLRSREYGLAWPEISDVELRATYIPAVLFRAHPSWKDRVVTYDHVYRQINATVQKYCENEKWR